MHTAAPLPRPLAPVVLPAAPAVAPGLALTGVAGQLATYTLVDGVGRVVRRQVAAAGTAVAIGTAGLAAGLYAWRVEAAGRQAGRRVGVK